MLILLAIHLTKRSTRNHYKSIFIDKVGGAENLLLSKIEKPKIKPDEVLIKTKAISINPVDVIGDGLSLIIEALLVELTDNTALG